MKIKAKKSSQKDGVKNMEINGFTFDSYLVRCAEIAMESEWIIEPEMREWSQWWRLGMAPREAVTRLFQLVENAQ